MKFSYRCEQGHAFTVDFAPGCAPETTPCLSCFASRDYSVDFESHSVNTGDSFRSYHLSGKKDRAAVEQQRRIGGPVDNFDRRRIECAQGIKFVGDDTSGMSKLAQRGIADAKAKAK